MTILELDAPVEPGDLDALLAFLPLLEAANRSQNESVDLGSLATSFQQCAYEHGFVRSFDWMRWTADKRKSAAEPEGAEHPTMKVCIQLLTAHIRGDRFSEGHLESVIRSGEILAILKSMQS